MPLLVNLRHLEAHELELEGELPLEELDLESHDEVVRAVSGIEYRLTVQKVEGGLLAQGTLGLTIECRCVRCLKPFTSRVKLDHWSEHLPLVGEDAVPVVNDCVDLTPLLREDMLLEFPQHPLCSPECAGLPGMSGKLGKAAAGGQSEEGSPAWNELNKLKF